MKRRQILRWISLILGAFILVTTTIVTLLWWYFHPSVSRFEAIVYGQRHGRDLTFDMVRPTESNGLGIVLMVSGGWKSSRESFQPWIAAPLLRRGYTIFAVSHLSQPKATVMEIVEDVNRAVRFIRHHAQEYGINPQQLGVTGGSAGGHLSLMLATRGGPGSADSGDLVDRESSAVQAVAIFFPVTDLLNLGTSTENAGDGGPPKSFVKAFGPQATNLAFWRVIGREVSPIYHITSNLPPVLILHGDADTLTPLEQSEWFQARAHESGSQVEVKVRPGKKHGWIGMIWDIRLIADWFDRHLVNTAASGQPDDRSGTRPAGDEGIHSAVGKWLYGNQL